MKDIRNSWIYLVLSAVIYGLSFVYLETMWWLVLCWPFIMWYTGIRSGFSPFQGFCWAVIAVGLQTGSLMYGVYGLACGSMIIKIFFISLWIALMSLPGLIWFYGVKSVTRQASERVKILWWCVTTWLYLMWMEYGCLLLCGTWCGYSLISPLVPLNQSQYLWPVSFIGRPFFLACWLGFSAWMLFCGLLHLNALLCMSVIGVGTVLWYGKPHEMAAPSWVEHVGVIRSCFLLDEGPDGSVTHCVRHIKKLCGDNAYVRCIIMSESSFYHPAVIERWHELARDMWLHDVLCPAIMGGYYVSKGGFYNTIAFVEGDRVIAKYYKSHATPFIEKIPWMLHNSCIKKLFHKAQGELILGNGIHPVWEIMPGVRVVPYVCSELFCAARQLDDHHNLPILALCNTRWASSHMQRLMLEGARLRALEWNREILFIAQNDASWCSPHGTVQALTRESLYC